MLSRLLDRMLAAFRPPVVALTLTDAEFVRAMVTDPGKVKAFRVGVISATELHDIVKAEWSRWDRVA